MRRRSSLAAALALVLASTLAATPAWAAPSTHVVQGDVLRLVSTADWDAASNLLPGAHVQWDVEVSADAPDPGTVSIGISATGGAPLVVDASLCMQQWEAGACPVGAVELRSAWDIPRDGVEVALAEVADTEVAHLRLVVSLAEEDGEGSTEVRVHAQGAGESVMVGPDGGLATTGMSPVVPWILGGGVALLVLGVGLVVARRRRGARSDDGGET